MDEAVKKLTTILVAIGFLSAGCLNVKEYPVEPYIHSPQLSKIVVKTDTLLQLSFGFTDGDGDIGLYTKETQPPYQYNMFIDFYRLRKGVFNKIIFPSPEINFNGRIPILTPDIQNKSIKGVIKYDFNYRLMRSFLLRDTISLDVYIVDRALHKSNTIRTQAFIVD